MTVRSLIARLMAVALVLLLAPFSQADSGPAFNQALPQNISSAKPWYSFKQLSQGAKIFKDNCASCHGKQAQGAADWRQQDALGRNRPPPLNGRGHDWHHRINELFDTVKYGTVKRGGGMPAWAGKLSDQEIVAVIGWFQSRWPKQVYRDWVDRPHH